MNNSHFVIDERIQIPLSEIELAYTKSSGPGGQNVNKVNSKASLRWNVVESSCLPEDMKFQLLLRLGPRLNHAGELIIMSDRFRDQIRNREDCFEKLRECVAAAAYKPKPRKKTKPTRTAREKSKRNKRLHSEKKIHRRKPQY